jgi:hypothetical protein
MRAPVGLGIGGSLLAASLLIGPAQADRGTPAGPLGEVTPAVELPPVSEAPTIGLLTMGPGDHPFSKFGHVAIVVRDPVLRREDVYNYGTFTFDSPWLIADFLEGKLRYWLSIDSLSHTVAMYRRQQRSVLLQELALAPDAARELAAFLRDNARPENKYYRYDYYLDNCSTRIRDAIDRAASGRLRAASQGPGRLTFREHTMRLVADDVPLYAALDIVMGRFIDQPITPWDEAFLPEELANIARRARLPTASGEVPLVSRELVLSTSDRAERTAPPRWTWRFGTAGTLTGAAAVVLARWGGRRGGRVVLAVAQAILGAVAGLLGIVFTLLWALTDHLVAYQNENLLLCAPFAVGLAVTAVGLGRGRRAPTRWSFRISLALAMLATFDLLLKVALHGGGQNNGAWLALFLPLWWGIALANGAAWRAIGSSASSRGFAPEKAEPSGRPAGSGA